MEPPKEVPWGTVFPLLVIYGIGTYICLAFVVVGPAPQQKLMPIAELLAVLISGTLAGRRAGHPVRGTILAIVAAIIGVWIGNWLGHAAFDHPWLYRLIDRLAHYL
jgi:hypothetical protein